MQASDRLHSLDNLRAVMMWLGIVIHVAAMYTVGPSPLPWHDTATSRVADLLMAFIHTFRMPVFFIVAGFFVAMLMHVRGPSAMLLHRARRLALPFLLFWPPLLLAIGLAVMVYFFQAQHGHLGIDWGFRLRVAGKPTVNTMHLWFLYLLWWLVVVTAAAGAVARRLPPAWGAALPRLLRSLSGSWWGAVVLTLPLVLAGAGHPHGIFAPDGSLLPHWSEWLHNGLFFAAGCALYGARETLLPLYARHAWACAAAGVPFFVATLVIVALGQRGAPLPQSTLLSAFTYNLTSWLWSAAAIGLFVRHLSQRRPALAYLADSAYWVYLVHFPLTVVFGFLLYAAPLGALTKMILNVGFTTLACLLAYQLLVRGRWIGRLLNGGPKPGTPSSRADGRPPLPA